jgi:hypothetical protein
MQNTESDLTTCPTQLELSQIVSRHILEFEKLFVSAQIDQQKLLVRQWVSQIEISEEKGKTKAHVFIRTLPKTPEFRAITEKLREVGPAGLQTVPI